MFTTHCFIRKNTEKLKNKLKNLGYSICPCSDLPDSIWLENFPPSDSIHGVGYIDEASDECIKLYLKKNSEAIDCGTNEDLFLAIAALRDDTDKYQWFIEKHNDHSTFWMCDLDKISDCYMSTQTLRKATVKELINHFKS